MYTYTYLILHLGTRHAGVIQVSYSIFTEAFINNR